MDRRAQTDIEGIALRGNPVGPVWPQGNLAVPVAPVIGMAGEERRLDVQLLHGLQLIEACRLRMDRDGTLQLRAILAVDRAHAIDQLLYRGVAVDVDKDLPVMCGRGAKQGLQLVVRDLPIPRVIRRTAWRYDMIGVA